MKKKETWLILLMALALLIGVNLLAQILVASHSLKLDLTSSGIYQISQETVDLMKDLEKDVTVYYIYAPENGISELEEMLERYDGLSEHLQFVSVNPYTEVLLLETFESNGLDWGFNTLVIECEGRYDSISMDEMYIFSNDNLEVVYFNGESKLTSGILSSTVVIAPKIGVIVGHGEVMSTQFQKYFDDNGMELYGFNLQDDIPEDIQLLLMLAPQADYETSEIAILSSYMNQGGALLAFSDPSVYALPQLDEFFADWGITWEDNVIFDNQQNIGSNPSDVIGFYVEHDITEYFQSNPYYTIMSVSRSINSDFTDYTGESQISALIVTADSAYGRDIETSEKTLEKLATDAEGPFLLAVVSTRTTDTGKSKLIAVGSKQFYKDELLTMASAGNLKLIGEMVEWCVDDTNTVVSIAPKKVGGENIVIATKDAYGYGALLVVGIPLILLGLGVGVSLKRKFL